MSAAPASPAQDPVDGVAIVGISCQFPGAADHHAFWRNLRAGVESITFFDDDALLRAGCSPREISAPNYVKAGGVLENIEAFDAAFFGYTPREASLMDPQFRLLLEHCWRGLEDAAHDPRRAPERVAVYAGMSMSGYLFHLLNQRAHDPSIGILNTIITNDKDALATRIAYAFDLRGPCLTVQTFCSTSLVCTHLGVQSILSGETDLALAAGVSIKVPHVSGYARMKDSITSSDGHTRAFDENSDGTIFTNGVGVVVLKALDLARRDGNRIYAVVRGSALNNDGAKKVGYTAPGVQGQAGVIREALSNADLSPDEIAYVETHGTGTRLGDATELNALKKVFKGRAAGVPTCGLGSVKTNIGHADVASGVAGLIKASLAVHHRELPPSLHCRKPNAELDAKLFHVHRELVPWTAKKPLHVGVSSFGIGGTNAHVVLGEAPALAPRPAPGTESGARLLVLSARSQRALDTTAENLRSFLAENPAADLTDVAHTLRVGRVEFNHRRTVLCRGREDACVQLATPVPGQVQKYDQAPVRVEFDSERQDWVKSAVALHAGDPVFRRLADELDQQLAPLAGSTLFSRPDAKLPQLAPELAGRWLDLVFPVLAWRTLQRSGVAASTYLGRGVGKLAALVCAEAISIESAAPAWARLVSAAAAPTTDLAAILREEAPQAARIAQRPKVPLPGLEIPPNAGPRAIAEAVVTYLRTEENAVAAPEAAAVVLGFGGERLPKNAHPRRLCVPALLHASEVPSLLGIVGALWNFGVSVDWAKLNAFERGRRIGLPTYPFERDRHWVDAASGRPAIAERQRRPAKHWFYTPTWHRLPLVGASAASASPGIRVIVGVDTDEARALSAALDASDGQRSILISTGPAFEARPDGNFVVESQSEAQLHRAIEAIAARSTPPREWVYLGGFANPDPFASYFGLATLGKALQAGRDRAPVSLVAVTQGLQQVLGDEQVSARAGTLPGLVRALRTEIPWVRALQVDLGSSPTPAAAGWLLKELRSPGTATAIAYRHGHRWVQAFEEIAPPNPAEPNRLRENGVYVITGGLGGLGFELARHLVTRYRARVTVLGRKAVAELDSVKAARWQELAKLNPAVSYLETDITDAASVDRALTTIRAAAGSIDGVFHLAGVAGGGLLSMRTVEAAAAVLRPKVLGWQALNAALTEQPPGFIALFSSVTSLLGEVGQADYAAANAYLDAVAAAGSGACPVIAINWDTWAEIGMAKETQVAAALAARRQHRLKLGLSTAEGMEALETALRSGLNRIVVATTDFRAELTAPVADAAAGEAPPVPTGNLQPRPKLSVAYVAPGTDAEKLVAALWQQLFGIAGLGADDDFFELGGHSLLAVQFLEQLRTRIPGLEISLSDVFARPTIRALAEAVTACQESAAMPAGKTAPLDFEADVRATVTSLLTQRGTPPRPGTGIDLSSIATDLAWQLKDRHRFPVYDHELKTYASLEAAVTYLVAEHRLVSRPAELVSAAPIEYHGFEAPAATRSSTSRAPLPAMAFLHSTPRAGSTIVRLMLAANPRLFVPPELGLFNFDTMQTWARQADRGMVDGLVNTFAAASGGSRESAQARVSQLVAEATSTDAVYRELLGALSGLLMVEKTPGYGMQWPLLEAMEASIGGARYLHLVRHPHAVIESYVRNRFFRRMPSTETDPYALAERMWVHSNRNLDRLALLAGPDRYLRVRYEDLVAQPQHVMPQVCTFLGVPFDPAMLDAYGTDRAIAGPGDPSIFTHRKVEAELADAWKHTRLPRPMCTATRELAASYGYDFPDEVAAAAASASEPGSDDAASDAAVEQLLGKIDELSPEEIERALRQLENAEA